MGPQQCPLSDCFRGNHRRSGAGTSQGQLSSDGLSPVPEDFTSPCPTKGSLLLHHLCAPSGSWPSLIFRPCEVQFCRAEGQDLVWVFGLKSSWPHVPAVRVSSGLEDGVSGQSPGCWFFSQHCKHLASLLACLVAGAKPGVVLTVAPP